MVVLRATPLGPEPRPSLVGHRINLADPPAAFPAHTAFFVRHGFVCPSPGGSASFDSRTEFRLSVDGALVPLGLDQSITDSGTERWSVARFRRGLAPGRHVFAGSWHAEGVLVLSIDATIDFVGQTVIPR